MAVPSSGEIRLSKIAAEKHFDNYNHNQSVASPISLKDVSTSGNSGGSGVSYDTTNIANLNANKPDGSTPHAMSEFYAYDHHPNLSTSPLSASFGSGSSSGNTITVNHPNSSTWYVSSKPSWVTITTGSTSSSSPSLGSLNCVYSVSANSNCERTGDLVITLNVGTTSGAHPSGTNSTTTRTTALQQSAGSGCDDEGLGGGGDGGRGFP